jgi:hypothetical protein
MVESRFHSPEIAENHRRRAQNAKAECGFASLHLAPNRTVSAAALIPAFEEILCGIVPDEGLARGSVSDDAIELRESIGRSLTLPFGRVFATVGEQNARRAANPRDSFLRFCSLEAGTLPAWIESSVWHGFHPDFVLWLLVSSLMCASARAFFSRRLRLPGGLQREEKMRFSSQVRVRSSVHHAAC